MLQIYVNYRTFQNIYYRTKHPIRMATRDLISKEFITILVSFIIIFCSIKVSSQSYNIEPLDSVIIRIEQNAQINQEKRVSNYGATKVKAWYHLLPSIGYNAIANGISINFNLGNLISIADRKRTQQYQITEWQRTENLETTKKIIQAKTAYRQLENALEHALQHQQVLEVDSIRYLIKQKANQDHKINTEDYLEAKRKYLIHQSNIYEMRQKVIELVNQISLIQQKELLFKAPFIIPSNLQSLNSRFKVKDHEQK